MDAPSPAPTFRRWHRAVLGASVLACAGCADPVPPAREPVVLTTPVRTLAMNISMKPATRPGDFALRVSTRPPVIAAPTVELQDADGGAVRQVVLTADADGWATTVSGIPQVTVGSVYVTAIGDNAIPEMQTLRFASRGLMKDRPGVVYSPDGQFGLVLPSTQVPADARFWVTTGDLVDPALPLGTELVAGPFTLMVLPDAADLIADITVNVPASPDAGGTLPAYSLRWLDVTAKAWVVLGGGPTEPNDKVVQAKIEHPGTFVLTQDGQ